MLGTRVDGGLHARKDITDASPAAFTPSPIYPPSALGPEQQLIQTNHRCCAQANPNQGAQIGTSVSAEMGLSDLDSTAEPGIARAPRELFLFGGGEPDNLRRTTPYRVRIRGLLPDAVQAHIQAGCNDILSTDALGMVSASLPIHCVLHLTPQQVAQAILAAPRRPIFNSCPARQMYPNRQ